MAVLRKFHLNKEALNVKKREDLELMPQVPGVGSWEYDVLKDEFSGTRELYQIYNVDSAAFKHDFLSTIELIHPEDRPKLQKAMEAHLAGKSCRVEYRIPQADGAMKYVIGNGEPIFDHEGQVVGVIGTVQDVTESVLLRQALQKSNENLNTAQSLAHIGSWEMEVLSGKITWSAETYRIFGLTPGEFDETFDTFLTFVHPEDWPQIGEILANPPKEESFAIELRIVRADGAVRFVTQLMKITFDQAGKPIIIHGTIKDVTEEREAQKKITYLANYDQLTGLPNSIYFKNQLAKQCGEAEKNWSFFGLLLLDIDGLTYVNEALGYGLGDRLIMEIAQKLKEGLEESVLICRYSGDQFILLVPGYTAHEDYQLLAEWILDLFAQPVKIDKFDLEVTLSVGISIFPRDADNGDDLLKFANLALRRAKRYGRNRVELYSNVKTIPDYKKFMLRNGMRRAIDRNQLLVYYQPIIKLESNQVLAAEALIRWDHPDWGLVFPKEFIEIAEETDQIIHIGYWLFKKVCQNYKQWLDAGLPAIKVAVNFSAVQFLETNLLTKIKAILDECDLDPQFLIIEITENVLLMDSEIIKANFRRMQALGIQIALDDFGTGFSSLTYLNTFKFDYIKIGRSFIKNLLKDETSRIITDSLIKLGHALRIKLVAEGIETKEQLSVLRRLTCYAGQGYLFSKALPVKEFEKILKKGRCGPDWESGVETEYQKQRKYFRVNFPYLLEAMMTIIKMGGKKVQTGNAKVVIKNMGPGGLAFTTNIRFPVDRDLILKFTTQLLGKDLTVYGKIVWVEEIEDNLYEYGLEFTIDENERMDLTRLLNQVQIKLRNVLTFVDGNFVADSPKNYFNSVEKRNFG